MKLGLILVLAVGTLLATIGCTRSDAEVRRLAQEGVATALVALPTLTPRPTATPQPTATPLTFPPTVTPVTFPPPPTPQPTPTPVTFPMVAAR